MGDASAHALVAPSGLNQTKLCAASLLLQFMAPPLPDSDEEAEGSAAHHHAVQWAMGRQMPKGTVFKYDGRDWTVDMDMENGSKLFAYHCVRGISGRYEDPVGMPGIHAQCYGTPDYWHARDNGARVEPDQPVVISRVDVKDYKYGHRYVDPFENWQLLAYAVGVIDRLNLWSNHDLEIVLTIIQPRAYHAEGPVREWRITCDQLAEIWLPRMHHRVAQALAADAPATVGPHCLDCKARHLCRALQHSAMHIVDFAGAAEAVEMPTEALAVEARIMHDAYKVLEARYEGLKAQIDALLRSGKAVPFWHLADGRSKLDWNQDVTPEAIQQLGQAIGLTLVKPVAALTPTQCVQAGVAEEVIAAYATRGPTGKTLKPLTTSVTTKLFGANRT